MSACAAELAAVRFASRRQRKAPPPWSPPDPAALPCGHVLALDQSLSSTGWIDFSSLPGGVIVHARGTLRPVTALTGYLGTWDKHAQLAAMLGAGEMAARIGAAHAVAWEAPPVGGGHRTESSLMAGALLYMLAGPGRAHVVSAQHASSLLTGTPRHGKREIGLAVARYVPESASRQWNEHLRDALAIGIAYLLDTKVS